MSMTASIIDNDPIHRFLKAHALDGSKRPIPLVATKIDVTIRGGLASVTSERIFRNHEDQSIEATMTFPVPADATLCALSARIDGRKLHAAAQARAKARETYEQAIAKGKAATLHEELLKGIHMLSVAHVRPDAEIIVTDTWTMPLSFIDGGPRLRIPTTVGDIYGRTPLSPSEELVTGSHRHEATLAIQCEDGTARLLRAGPAIGGRYKITLDAPIDIVVSGWTKRVLEGVAADGGRVTLDIEPAPTGQGNLDIDLLFDRSGSMGERAVGEYEGMASKFALAKDGLVAAIQEHFKAADRLRLWEFNDTARFVGEAHGPQCQTLIAALSAPNGGTEIGNAFDTVIASGKAKDVIVVTDGKSYALDPQNIARGGIRVTAILIGDDALDAGVAHLAFMTGGQCFIAGGCDAVPSILAAIEAARTPSVVPEPVEGTLSHVVALRRGARIVASWGETCADEATAQARQIGATAAMLAIPLMREDAAAALAEREGIVCHLTSLVLVDEAGVQQAGLPASRKIELSPPRAAAFTGYANVDAFAAAVACAAPTQACREPMPVSTPAFASRGSSVSGLLGSLSKSLGRREAEERRTPHTPARSLRRVAIDWDRDPEALRRGDLSGLATDVADAIRAAAQLPEVMHLAKMLVLDPVVVIIALIAHERGRGNRSAQRIAQTILGNARSADIECAVLELAL